MPAGGILDAGTERGSTTLRSLTCIPRFGSMEHRKCTARCAFGLPSNARTRRRGERGASRTTSTAHAARAATARETLPASSAKCDAGSDQGDARASQVCRREIWLPQPTPQEGSCGRALCVVLACFPEPFADKNDSGDVKCNADPEELNLILGGEGHQASGAKHWSDVDNVVGAA